MQFSSYELITSHLDTTRNAGENETPECIITVPPESRQDGGKCCTIATDCGACTAWTNCGNPSEKPIETPGSILDHEVSELRDALRLISA